MARQSDHLAEEMSRFEQEILGGSSVSTGPPKPLLSSHIPPQVRPPGPPPGMPPGPPGPPQGIPPGPPRSMPPGPPQGMPPGPPRGMPPGLPHGMPPGPPRGMPPGPPQSMPPGPPGRMPPGIHPPHGQPPGSSSGGGLGSVPRPPFNGLPPRPLLNGPPRGGPPLGPPPGTPGPPRPPPGMPPGSQFQINSGPPSMRVPPPDRHPPAPGMLQQPLLPQPTPPAVPTAMAAPTPPSMIPTILPPAPPSRPLVVAAVPVQPAVSDTAGATGISTTKIFPAPTRPLKTKRDPKKLRLAGGQVWEDHSLDDWDQNDFRIFCGDLGNDVNDDTLARSFSKYPTFLKAKVIRDKFTKKTKGYGFVSFKDPHDFMQAMREMNGKYIGNRPVKLRKSTWRDRCFEVVKKKDKEKKRLGFK